MPGPIDPETLYNKQQLIGKGSFGQVFKGIDIKTSEPVAIKIIDLDAAEDELEDIQQEINILKQLKSDYITKLHGSYIKGSSLWIVMDYCGGGSCLDLMRSGPLEEGFIATILRELLKGLEYLHSENKLHRDIKAANVLVCSDGAVKIADFGVSGQISATMTIKKMNTFVGSPFWMAPEVIEQNIGYDKKADIWSLGITALELANGHPPYSDLPVPKALFLIPRNEPPRLEGGNFSRGFREFVSLCLQRDPHNRPHASELLKHRFIKAARKPQTLTDLIAKHEQFLIDNGDSDSLYLEMNDLSILNDADEVEWDFDIGTVRPKLPPRPPISSSSSFMSPISPALSASTVFEDEENGSDTVRHIPKRPFKPLPILDERVLQHYHQQQVVLPKTGSSTSNTPTAPPTPPSKTYYNPPGLPSTSVINGSFTSDLLMDIVLHDLNKKSENAEAVRIIRRAFQEAEGKNPGVTHSFVDALTRHIV
ncbi:kinase-like domain-containing protein [Obelidium mucronatum]|nr:kinase-like domain-containing protein [Obelidium mucronatum]